MEIQNIMPSSALDCKINSRKRSNSEPDLASSKRVKVVQESPFLQESKQIAANPLDCWVQTGQWPVGLAMEPPKTLKRTSSGSSTSKRSSLRPTERIKVLTSNGVEIEHDESVYKTNDNDRLWHSCQPIAGGFRTLLTPFPGSKIMTALHRASSRNEQRLQRDILPLLVPSPAWLELNDTDFDDGADPIFSPHLSEELSAEWIKCTKTFGDTKPRPDFAVGWSVHAFSDAEQKTLRVNADLGFPSQYTPEMWFPFLVCECKSRDRPFLEAKRQAINGGALAACALVHLYQAAYLQTNVQKIHELSGQILTFCVIMNEDQAELWGVYAGITIAYGALQVKYRRKVLQRLYYDEEGQRGFTWFYNNVCMIYRIFGPKQLDMIKQALGALPEREANALSFTAAEELQQSDEPVTPLVAGGEQLASLQDQIRYLMEKIERQNEAARMERRELEAKHERQRKEDQEREERFRKEVAEQQERERKAIQEERDRARREHDEERRREQSERHMLLEKIGQLAGAAKV